MNPTSRVKIEVCGAKYYISSSEPEAYVKELGAQLSAQISDMLAQNHSLSVTDALVLCLLNYMDSYRKAEENTDHMRSQLTGYLEDAAKYRIEADEAKREIERLRRELAKRDVDVQIVNPIDLPLNEGGASTPAAIFEADYHFQCEATHVFLDLANEDTGSHMALGILLEKK